MFTGIVEELGRVAAVTEGAQAGSLRLRFEASVVTEGTGLGDSVAVNGCCLTVAEQGRGWWAADAVAETLARTNLGSLAPGDEVNLERPLRLADRLGGHLVQGHVDAVGVIAQPAPDLHVAAPPQVGRYLVEKGSVTVDGVSLTVVSVTPDGFTVAVIPHTMAVTTLGSRRVGDRVNLEVDVVAKYTERLLSSGVDTPYLDLASGASAAREGR